MIESLKSPSFASPVRLGAIGSGQISHIILPQLAAYGLRVEAVSDINATAAEALAAKLPGARVYTDTAKLLADPAIEIVYVATPPNTHRTLQNAALAAGKAVICEKPFVLNQAEAKQAAAEAAAFPNVAAGCCSARFRFTPTADAATQLIAAGKLGALRQVRIMAIGGIPKSIDHLPPWKRSAASAGGGLVADWCVYEVEWLRGVLGSAFTPLAATANFDYWKREGTDIESGYDVHLQCASGLDIYLTRRPEIGPGENRVKVRGTEGGLDLPFSPASGADNAPRLHTLAASGTGIETATLPTAASVWSDILCGPIVNLAQVARGHGTVAAPVSSQIQVHAVLDAILASGQSGRTVSIVQ